MAIVACQRCKKALATGVWQVDDKRMLLCGGCGLGYYPTTKRNVQLLAQFPFSVTPVKCQGPLRPTGNTTVFDNGAVFLEMACTHCAFSTDLLPTKAAYAYQRHVHEVVEASADEGEPQVRLDEEDSAGDLQSRTSPELPLQSSDNGQVDSSGREGGSSSSED